MVVLGRHLLAMVALGRHQLEGTLLLEQMLVVPANERKINLKLHETHISKQDMEGTLMEERGGGEFFMLGAWVF